MSSSVNKVAIIDYGVGNLFSISQACSMAGMKGVITSSDQVINNCGGVILPGVGSFGSAMQSLKKNNLISVIKEMAFSGKPFMGICLGMQLMFDRSYEFGVFEGLGIVQGEVVKFSQKEKISPKIKIPHIGWNKIYSAKSESWKNTILDNVPEGAYMYFVHSFYALPKDENIMLSETEYYGTVFCSSFQVGNIFGCQFHPEKSGPDGLEIYHSFKSIMMKSL